MQEVNSAFLYANLTARLAQAQPDVRERVNTHIRLATGGKTLEEYHTNGASEKEKCDLYSPILWAVVKNDVSNLKSEGSRPAGGAPKPPQDAPEAPKGCQDTPKGQNVVQTPKSTPAEATVEDQVNDKIDALATALQALKLQRQKPAELKADETRLRQLIAEILAERMKGERVLMIELIHRILTEKIAIAVTVKKD